MKKSINKFRLLIMAMLAAIMLFACTFAVSVFVSGKNTKTADAATGPVLYWNWPKDADTKSVPVEGEALDLLNQYWTVPFAGKDGDSILYLIQGATTYNIVLTAYLPQDTLQRADTQAPPIC